MSLALITTTLAVTLAPLLNSGEALREAQLEQQLEAALAELVPPAPSVAPIAPATSLAVPAPPQDEAADEPANLAAWLALYCEGVGVRVVADEPALQRMRGIEVESFGQAFNVVDSLAEFQVSYQDLLVTHGFILTSNGAPKKYLLHDVEFNGGRNMAPYWVESTDRALMTANPAILMSTSVAVRYIDSRQASTMLRAKLPRHFEQALALSPRTLTLTTTGGKLAELLETIDRIEAAETAHGAESNASAGQRQVGVGGAVAAGHDSPSGAPVNVVQPDPAQGAEAEEHAAHQELATRIYLIDSEHARDVVRTAERLVQARFSAGLGQREWIAGDGSRMPWPQPRFHTNETSTRVLVQAAAEDLARIEADLTLAKRLHDGAAEQTEGAD